MLWDTSQLPGAPCGADGRCLGHVFRRKESEGRQEAWAWRLGQGWGSTLSTPRSQGVPRTAESERLTALFSQVREGRHLPALLAAGAPRRPLPVQRLPLPAPLPRRVPAVQGGGVQGLRLLLPLLQRLRGEGQEGRGLLPAEGGRRRGAHPAAGPTRRQEELG